MPKRTLTCRRGHSWQYTATGPIPPDVSTICPFCSAGGEYTVELTELTTGSEGASLRPGEMLGSFEILKEINRGAMGVIYKARQQGLNRLVALKVISPDRLKDPESMHRFQREVQAAALLSHPNIVTVFHTDLNGPWPYLAMEYVPGIDLSRLVKKAGPLSVRDACMYIRATAQGLEHAFDRNLVHRDIKPANLMVTPSPLHKSASSPSRQPTVKILDLGLARVTASHDDGETGELTRAGEFLGTPDYIAPEQAEDPRQADIRSDLYSLGCTFYFLLAGKAPFAGGNLVQKLRRQLTEPPPSVAARRGDVPPAVDALIRTLMACDPKDRYQTPSEVIEELDEILRGEGTGVSARKRQPPAAAAPPPTPTRAPPAPDPTPSTPAPTPAPPPPPRLSSMRVWAEASFRSPVLPAPVPGQLPVAVEAHPGGVGALSCSPDGQLLLSGGEDETLRLWDLSSFRETRCLAGDVGPVLSACLAPGGKWAASCAARIFKSDMVVQCWDLASGSERRRLAGHADTINSVSLIHDGRRLASASADRTIRLWALDQPGSPPQCLEGHTDEVTSVVFVSNEALLSGSHDGTVRLWNVKTCACRGTLSQGGKVQAVAFNNPSKRMAMVGDGLGVRQTDGTMTRLNGHDGPVLCVAFSPDGDLVVSGGADGTIRLWHATDGTAVHTYVGHCGKVRTVVFTADGCTIYSGGEDGILRRWTWPV
jgi:serine/threonine protein kinase